MLAQPYSKILRPALNAVFLCTLIASPEVWGSSNSRIIATGGASMIEGSAGGGIVPWAVLTGYADEDELGGAIGITHVNAKDFSLNAASVSMNWNNRIELSAAKQSLDIGSIGPGEELEQNIFGAKVRLTGDLIYGQTPQIALGLQYKKNTTFTIPKNVKAVDDSGVDVFLAASKLWLNGPFNRSVFANGTLRATRANQLGLLGFGGDRNSSHQAMLELSAGLFLNRHWVIGTEYRQKPNNLRFAKEQDWQDVFVGWFPNKRVSMVLAWAGLGSIAGFDNQDAVYISLQVSQ